VIALPERVIGIGRNGRSAWPESAVELIGPVEPDEQEVPPAFYEDLLAGGTFSQGVHGRGA
jgi:hypothetical protein